jgi:predicted nucleic acid-binding Zn ribbon protein
MKYEDKYPNAKHLEEVAPSLVKFLPSEECLICGAPTTFGDIDFGAPFCSEECFQAMWEQYIRDSCSTTGYPDEKVIIHDN